ncbi:putative homoserine dehydrogenase, catalytic, aspartate/homoserine dehydrogenase, NAD-binding [Acrodontium crateriforme]|uniref:Homoserine dehydrogenase n=1 Tax=Acrodontium crateriforme TaxID=150365 RepID=A0AAQ3M2W2_9PEZI|nr:putative homoserine dehydrogenase, catalytic, aspartate/homoserine dehydrogenase, NAD-binding [Acrodontium crateriforme]
MSPPQQIFAAVVGVGGVGKAFLAQLDFVRQRLAKQNPAIDLRLVLVRRSTKQIASKEFSHLDTNTVLKSLESSNEALPSFEDTVQHLSSAPGRVILVDNTSDLKLASTYPSILARGVSVVTPNKKGFSDNYKLWNDIFTAAANGSGPSTNGYVFHESTVGAGLPVLSSLRELIDTGDEVTRIEGVFSGTMSFLFNSFMPVGGGGGAFGAEVAKAKELGYTEPDPRDDLNGLDVARKLTILARIAGLPVESPTSFPVESLIPKELESCQSGDEFLQRLPEFDGQMDSLKAAAAKEGKVVRFVGSIDMATKSVKVGLQKFDVSHPIAALKGSDNIINFYTKRYGSNPLIIQGAGAGGDVTAMGVTADLLKVVRLVQKN